MICAYCRRPIPRKDVSARLYNLSRATGNHYCLRADCLTVGKRLHKAERLAAELAGMTPLERTIAANDPDNGDTATRIVALTLVKEKTP